MRIAIVSESPSDESAVKILVDRILGTPTELVSNPRLRPEGWPSVLNLLPTIIRFLHYNSDAEGLVLVVDSDESAIHDEAHEIPGSEEVECRMCQLNSVARREFGRLRPVPSRVTIKLAIGLAVPAIEAWFQCGLDPHVNEATWRRKLLGERITYDKRSLKYAAYGSDRAPTFAREHIARQAAERFAENTVLGEQLFPGGFGCFVRDLRSW